MAHSSVYAHEFAYYCVLIGVFITSLYSFRLLFIVFHGSLSEHNNNVREPQLSIVLPLILLSIPSMLVAWPTVGPMVFENFFSNSIVQPSSLELFGYEFTNSLNFLTHSLSGPVTYIAISGIGIAYLFYIKRPEIPNKLAITFKPLYKLLQEKYYFDYLYENILAKFFSSLGNRLWNLGDIKLIDNYIVNGTAKKIESLSNRAQLMQSGYIYHYALMMMLGLSIFLGFIIINRIGMAS